MDMEKLYGTFKKSGGISIDSRTTAPGFLFFALKGDNHDGNDYAQEALKKGAIQAIVDADGLRGKGIVKVDDALATLQQLAKMHRERLKIPVIGLTGSNGKTTTKELINRVLQYKYETAATPNNLNNHIGVPLTLLSIKESTDVAIVEMGANHLGEIADLCALANPTHGIITNIGKAHIGPFGGFDNIVRGKSELHVHLLKNNGVVFINSADPIVGSMARRFQKPILYPQKGDYYHCSVVSANPYITYKAENGHTIDTQLIGRYNFANIAAALTIGRYFGVADIDANEAIATYKPTNMRSQVIEKNRHTILLDTYNANPTSMQAAVNNLSHMEAGHKVAILGDMHELGDEAIAEHTDMINFVKRKHFDRVFFCGGLCQQTRIQWPGASYFNNPEALVSALKKQHLPPSAILIKASRAMQLEQVVEAIV